MRRLVLGLLLGLSACAPGGDENNCQPLTCAGCCTPDGTCRIGNDEHVCGSGAAACADCTKTATRCQGLPLSCR
jgi:hypothetical protein